MAASEKYEYAVNGRIAQVLFQLLFPSLVKKHLNKHVIYYKFLFLIEKIFETCQVYYTILLI